MKHRVLLGTLALCLVASFLVPSSAEASSRYRRYSHRRSVVRFYDSYRSPYAYDYGYRYDDRYGYYDGGYYDPYYRPSVRYYEPYSYYRPYDYYRPYRPLLGVRLGGPHFGVFLRW